MKKRHIKNCIESYAESKPIRLHMPGHKGECVKNLTDVFGCDITELSFSDNLAEPQGVIKKAQDDISLYCGAKNTFLLTGGSTLGILAMCYAAKRYGKKLIIERTAHKSVFNCLKLFDITPLFFDFKNCDFSRCEYFETANNDVIGALITSPNYFGECLDLDKISSVLKQNEKLLFIDGAHGGHLRKLNGEKYAGKYADAWVDGTHKTMHALTQGALLHLNNSELYEYVKEGLDIFSTSSPSYPIMSSVESAVKTLFEYTDKQIDNYKNNLQIVFSAVNKRGFIAKTFDDPLKLTVFTNDESGIKIGKYLEKHGVYCELIGENLILFMFSLEFDEKTAQKLASVILSVPEYKIDVAVEKIVKPTVSCDYLTAVKSECEWVSLKDANGRVCAKNAGLFPPCSPLIIAGEIFDNDVIEALSVQNTFGVENGKVKVIKR